MWQTIKDYITWGISKLLLSLFKWGSDFIAWTVESIWKVMFPLLDQLKKIPGMDQLPVYWQMIPADARDLIVRCGLIECLKIMATFIVAKYTLKIISFGKLA